MQLDTRQWLRGTQMLLAAASSAGDWALALRIHLRLLNALLPHVPSQLEALLQGGGDSEAADGSGATLALLLGAAEQLAQQHVASAALDAASAFLHRHSSRMVLSTAPAPLSSNGANGGDSQQAQLSLHPMEAAMFGAVQRQLALVASACSASLAAAGPAAAQSQLNLKASGREAWDALFALGACILQPSEVLKLCLLAIPLCR